MSGMATECPAMRDFFPLYLYGELSFDEEERVESHLDGCADCRKALERLKEVHAAFDRLAIEPSPSLLRACRDDLQAQLLLEERALPEHAKRAGHRSEGGWWEQFVDALTLGPAHGSHWLRPAGALSLIAIGFLAARMIPAGAFGSNGALGVMGLGEPASRVRYVEPPSSDGKIQIVLDETRQRIITGRLEDQQFRALLLGAARDPSDPGLRAETVDILNSRAQLADVQSVLVLALQDQNAGVREKAMKGLQAFAQEPDVRAALAHVLLTDANPGLRTQAIDLLTKSINPNADRGLISALQELMERENNTYVRQRCRSALESVKASTETY